MNKSLKRAMFISVEQSVGEMVLPGRVLTVWQAQMDHLIQTKSVADKIVQSELSNTVIILQIAETVDELVGRAMYRCA